MFFKNLLKRMLFALTIFILLLNYQENVNLSWSDEPPDIVTRVESLPFPRLWKMNWYSPLAFRQEYKEEQGIEIGLDLEHTALMNTLRIFDLVVYGGDGFKDPNVADKFAYLKELNPNMVLLAQWSPSGNGLDTIDYSPYGELPFRPEWFSMLAGSTLALPAVTGDTTITVQTYEAEKFYQISPSGDPWNDNIFIQDLEDETKSEMVLLKGRDNTALYLHPQANYNNYDFSKIKFNHKEGTPVWIVHSPNWHAWWGYNLSSECPRSDIDGLTWGEYYSQYIWDTFSKIQFFEGQPLVDGIHLDAFEELFYGPFNSFEFVEPYADLNLDSIADIEQHSPDYIDWTNNIWAQGHLDFAENLRNKAIEAGQPAVPITQLGWGETQPYINGQLFENLPTLEYDPELTPNRWVVALSRYDTWMNDVSGPDPKICMAMGGYSPADIDNYRLMRKSLAFTLMDNGYFTYDGGADVHGYTLWWFDEYAVDSSGRSVVHDDGTPITAVDPTQMDEDTYQKLKAAKGYLGMPLGESYNLGGEDLFNPLYGVLRRDFEQGVVFCNLRSNGVSVPVDPAERLVRIKGTQDPAVNNGEAVGDSLILPVNDGIILLRQEKFNHIPQLGVIGDKSVPEDKLLKFTISAADADGDHLSLTVKDLPAGASFNDNGDNTAAFSWKPTFEQAGQYTVVFRADDKKGGIASEAIAITVIDVDITPPVISDIQTQNITYNLAEIIWVTDESATSKVEYGLDSNYDSIVEDRGLVAQHSIQLDGLEYLTVYHYRVISEDARGNQAISPDYTFTTAMPIVSGDLTSEVNYVLRGGTINLQAAAHNESDVEVKTNLWIDDALPDGSPNPDNPINKEVEAVTLAPHQSQNFVFGIYCPIDEPTGFHTVTLKIGQVNGIIFAADSIQIEIKSEMTRKKNSGQKKN